ncbi:MULTISPECIES: hypothetical protein [Prochlorococcus]|uniref:Uncharacterized protein n=1 Tax=Prochlorococcus marinus (strain SARG / CCMP1375 / SS120) TaxID=167539 RepID=Q7VAI9_PROMA|nr:MULTISPECIES: hypothetical protein [Prochlorococcus]AAQ00517.1 Predicted protein family PM-11 [Prochlorococcus marinus subsp. marinus str. CCMP1375]KGG10313.1 hypothetical protein EV04_1979 [Prochlorococcus marinus str. LG]KGG22600.1 hypothetical protein EV08_0015 [Prochlorococcus marinus str. SS2]KGG24247.1 hypothetical protein EV09_0854 [Prochlorococcus marinus str. SS35]KGG33140.1 hypothetical protein EV10_0773 [Prochlorococcus marinus str. SS51]
MNYQLLLEYYSLGTELTDEDLELLDLELYTQIESIKTSYYHGCLEVAPEKICLASEICKGNLWITCLATVLDKLKPSSLASQDRVRKVFDELLRNNYLVIH